MNNNMKSGMSNANNKLMSRLGLAMRAGKVVSGDEGVMNAIRSGQAMLVIVAEDAAHNARKKYRDKCAHYNVPLREALSRYELGQSIGKPERVAVAVTDRGFAELIENSLNQTAEVDRIE